MVKSVKNNLPRSGSPGGGAEKNSFRHGRGLGTSLSKEMRKTLATIQRVATTDLSVFIAGEQGSGREWAARTIHELSPRAGAPVHVVDCAALTNDQMERELFGYEAISWQGVDIRPSAFEAAAGGTLLVEEIQLLPAALHAKIAHAVEYQCITHRGNGMDQTFDTRLLATIRQDQLNSNGAPSVYPGLLQRFSPILIEMPSLRQRKEDIVLLIDVFLDDLRLRLGCAVPGIAPAALELCEEFNWPGNIRQLRSAIEYASVMCGGQLIQPHHLPSYVCRVETANQSGSEKGILGEDTEG
jgi:DNA-binding NtrC family response regulator